MVACKRGDPVITLSGWRKGFLFFVGLHVNFPYMKTRRHQLYHLFLFPGALNMLLYHLFIGRSKKESNQQEFFDDPLFNYFFFISGWLLITWITYFLCRDTLKSRRLTVLHLIITTIIVFMLPVWVTHIYATAPGGYSGSATTSPLFGSLTRSFFQTIILLVLSDLLLLMNFFKKE